MVWRGIKWQFRCPPPRAHHAIRHRRMRRVVSRLLCFCYAVLNIYLPFSPGVWQFRAIFRLLLNQHAAYREKRAKGGDGDFHNIPIYLFKYIFASKSIYSDKHHSSKNLFKVDTAHVMLIHLPSPDVDYNFFSYPSAERANIAREFHAGWNKVFINFARVGRVCAQGAASPLSLHLT